MGLGSGIRKNLFRIPDPDPGVKKAPDPGFATLPESIVLDDFQTKIPTRYIVVSPAFHSL
jgi:hypothetical protein